MNRGRKIKPSLSIKDEENNSPKHEPTATASKHKLLTPCRRVGLNRKRKNIISGSSSELNISSPNNSLTEIDISVKEHDSTPETNKINIETPALKKTPKPRKSNLGARKRQNHTTNTDNDVLLSPEEIIKKYKQINNIVRDVSVVLTRCDFDKHILNRNNVREPSVDISMRIENEAISSTPLESTNSEIQTNQISTTIEDATSTLAKINESVVTEKNAEEAKAINNSVTSRKIKDLFGENSDDSDFESSLKRKKRKRFSLKTSPKTNKKDTTSTNEDTNDDSTQNSLDGIGREIPKNKPEKKYKTSPKINKKDTTSINEDTNDDSTQNSLDSIGREIPKNKPEKNNKTSPKTIKKHTTSTNEDTNDDSTQNSLDGIGTDIPKNKTKTHENFFKKAKKPINKNNDEDTNESLEETNADIPKTKTKPGKQEKQKTKMHKRDTDSQIDSDEIPEFNVSIPRKKRKRSSSHSKKSPKINKKESATKPRQYISDSDDDFMEKPRREKKDPDIKKKINIPAPDPLNRIEHIRIRENKSYTIMHMNNISSYVKYYDNDVNLKRTESDDNQQTTSQPVVSNVKTSMILERKNYLNKGSQESNPETTNEVSDGAENSEPINVVSDRIENPETTGAISDSVTEISNNLGCNNAVSDIIENSESNNAVSDGFAGFTNADFIENPEFTNINNFSLENADSNDIENPYFNDIENSNDTIDKPSCIETKTVSDTENPKPISDIEKPGSVSDAENPDDPQNAMKNMLKLKSNLINQIKMKRDKLDSLKRIMAYKEEHNLDDLTKTTLQFKYTLQEALVDLLSHLKTHTERNFNMLLLLGFLKIPSEMVGYNDETKSFE